MEKNAQPIAVFDSGVGGLSVLREAIRLMPNENFIYFGDSKNAPYGTKSVSEVKALTIKNIEYLMEMQAKAIVIACNTATAAAIEDLRDEFKNMPVLGIEPALKPAVEKRPGGNILVMATPVTIKQDKFKNLLHRYEKDAKIIPLPCPGLMEFIEKGDTDGEDLRLYLSKLLAPYKEQHLDAVVFGCTHYPFAKDLVKEILGEAVLLLDGGLGVAKELKRQLEVLDLLNPQQQKGQLVILNSDENPKEVRLSYQLLEKPF